MGRAARRDDSEGSRGRSLPVVVVVGPSQQPPPMPPPSSAADAEVAEEVAGPAAPARDGDEGMPLSGKRLICLLVAALLLVVCPTKMRRG